MELRSYGLDDSLPRGNGSAYQLGSTLDLGQLNDVLRFSLEHGFDAAAIGASELLADLGNSSLLANLQSPLMVALHSPNRRVRFAAARSIMKIDPRHAFPGASYFLETLIDLAQATGDPQAIVVTPRGDVRAENRRAPPRLWLRVTRGRRWQTCPTAGIPILGPRHHLP